MHTRLLPTLVLGFAIGIIGCGSSGGETPATGGSNSPAGGSTGGTVATGGKASGGSTGGTVATGGKASGGSTGGTVATGGKASGGSTGGTASGGSTGGNTGGQVTGGTASGGTATGGTASGGTASGGTGGTASGGTASGGTGGTASGGTASGGTGGTATGGKATGGTATGGSTGGGGAATGGSSGTGGAGGGTAGGDPKPSKGCSVKDGAKTLTTGGTSIPNGLPTSTRLKIKSKGQDREYVIDIPADYDATHPYRLIFSWHQAYGSANGNANGQYPANPGPNFDAKNYAFFGLRREATTANQPAIFVAPQGITDFPWDYARDVVLFDDLLALVTANLCIDESRVFTTGFSFGAMMSYALSITRQTKLRAAVTMAAANYNLPNEPTDSNAAPIAYLGFTGMSDDRCPWGDDSRGGKACVLQHAKDNGCTVPGSIQTTTKGSKKYLCYDFEGCKAGYPVKVCTFDGNHTPSSIDDGISSGDDGLKSFIPTMSWKFISQL